MRRYLVPLFLANGLAYLIVALSYAAYSRILTAAEFGIYSVALTISTLATIVLDGGIKTSIIKHRETLSSTEEGALLTLMLLFSSALLLITWLGRGLVTVFYPLAGRQSGFIAAFTAVYIATYPWIGISTATLERAFAYSRLAWVESLGLALERATPILFIVFGHMGLYGFVLGLVCGRLVRVALLLHAHFVRPALLSGPRRRTALALIREGAWFQAGSMSSLVRDNLHVILIGPLFGPAWVGYYAWTIQLCAITSQGFVQISSRVSLPLTAGAAQFKARWDVIVRQIRVLTAITAPLLASALLLSAPVNFQFLNDKWHIALTLLPFMCCRMVPGIASTPVSTLLLVEHGARPFARAMWAWTVFEVLACAAAVAVFGAIGLAVSYSFAAWLGVFALARPLEPMDTHIFRRFCSAILARPALWVSVAMACVYLTFRGWFEGANVMLVAGLCLLTVAAAYGSESELRSVAAGFRGPVLRRG